MGVAFQPGASPASVANIRGHAAVRSSTAVFQRNKWDDEIWRELNATYQMLQYVMMVPEDKISGKTYIQPRVGRFGVRNKVEATPVVLQAYNESEFTMEFRRFQESSIAVEDTSKIFADYDFWQEWLQEISISINQDIDNWILGYRAVLQNLGHVVTAVDAGNNPTRLNKAALLAASLQMDLRLVPQNDRRWLFSPSQYTSLFLVDDFVNGDYVSGKPTENGEVGQLYGIPVIKNNNIIHNGTNNLSLVTGNTGGNRVVTNFRAPGVTDGTPANTSPYYPNPAINNDANGGGNHPGLTTTLPTTGVTTGYTTGRAYTGMLVRPGWLKFGFSQRPKMEMGRETTLISDIIVHTWGYDARVYRPENAVLIHSNEPV